MNKAEIPRFDHPLVETHCHLDYLKEQTVDETITRSNSVGVEKMVTISVEPSNLDTVLEIANKYEGVYCSQGIHPHEAKLWSDSVEQKIKKNAKEKKVVAIGEIGLDFHYNHSPPEKQQEVFKRQLEVAGHLGLPVIIHSREADAMTAQILFHDESGPEKRGVIHSFSSGKPLAQKAIDRGFYLGINGIVTFKKAESVREIVSFCPLENIILETDAPFLTPVPYRGRENAPFYLPFVANHIASIKKIPVRKSCRDNI